MDRAARSEQQACVVRELAAELQAAKTPPECVGDLQFGNEHFAGIGVNKLMPGVHRQKFRT